MTHRISRSSAQDGFTLVETMIAIAILSVGIVTLIAAFGTAVKSTQNAEENLIAREKALQAMESVYTARNTQQISFAQVANVANGGIFTNGATPLLCAGPDGLVNTTDDVNCPASGPCAAGPECIVLPGPDGILGTPDDEAMSLGNFTRSIAIATVPANPDLKAITVTVTYTMAGNPTPHVYTVNALISSFR